MGETKKKIPFREYLNIAKRFFRAYRTREYTKTPWKTLLSGIVALLYFLLPVDAIPDFFFILGYLDDATVFSLAIAALRKDFSKFLEWEASRIIGHKPDP